MCRRRPFGPSCLRHTNTRFNKSVDTPFSSCAAFWLLVSSTVRGVDMPLMQCPYLPVHWYSFRRPRKDDRPSQPPGVNTAETGLELRTLGSQAISLTAKLTPGLNKFLFCWSWTLCTLIVSLPWWRAIPTDGGHEPKIKIKNLNIGKVNFEVC